MLEAFRTSTTPMRTATALRRVMIVYRPQQKSAAPTTSILSRAIYFGSSLSGLRVSGRAGRGRGRGRREMARVGQLDGGDPARQEDREHDQHENSPDIDQHLRGRQKIRGNEYIQPRHAAEGKQKRHRGVDDVRKGRHEDRRPHRDGSQHVEDQIHRALHSVLSPPSFGGSSRFAGSPFGSLAPFFSSPPPTPALTAANTGVAGRMVDGDSLLSARGLPGGGCGGGGSSAAVPRVL